MTAVVAAILSGILQPIAVFGNVPSGMSPLEPTAQVLWLPGDQQGDGQRHECVLTAATRWSCPSVPAGESGVAVIVSNGVIGYVVVGPNGPGASGRAEWGRLVRVVSSLSGADGLTDLRVSSWTVDRPASRPNTRTFDVIPDTAFQVVKVSATSFWIGGPSPSPDAFLRLDGSGIARHDTAMQTVAAGPPDSPFVIDATTGVSIIGRVETRSREPVDGALLELFAKAPAEGEPVDEKALTTLPVGRLDT